MAANLRSALGFERGQDTITGIVESVQFWTPCGNVRETYALKLTEIANRLREVAASIESDCDEER